MATAKEGRRIGRLLAIGGAEDPDEKDMRILPHLVKLAGGKRARIVVCSSPSENPRDKVEVYGKLFEKIGVEEVFGAPITTRIEAEQESLVEAVDRATAVFFTGGDQLRLTALVAGTPFGDRVQERLYGEGLVVAGTSAGAAAMSGTMVIGGPSEGTVRRTDVDLAPGLGLWRDTVVDTHFNARGRVNRLMTIFAHNPQVLGIGIDENTAVEVIPGDRFTVIGAGAAMVFDGRVTHTNAPQAADEETLAITDSVIHVLPDGYGFNLRTKRPILPGGEEIPTKEAAAAP
ncbi:MAG TPA: cyanophycinase [Longimicrobiaceae bacterium]|nr:cyanophycinase [Longimicrobiaceae bacterium]